MYNSIGDRCNEETIGKTRQKFGKNNPGLKEILKFIIQRFPLSKFL